jgi:predicted Zn-ribbon and HTH transcriptional regulator
MRPVSDPLPPAVRIGNFEIQMRPSACQECGTTHQAHDFEERSTDDVWLVCRKCGADLQSIRIHKEPSDASAY